MTEYQAQRILARYFDWGAQTVVPNVYFAGWEMDVGVITRAGYLIEVEIKMTTGDWNADQKKDKWRDPARKHISRFYYAVPSRLIDRVPAWVPAEAGLIELVTDDQCRVVREAKRTQAAKLNDWQINKMLRATYFRFWSRWWRSAA